MPNVAAFVFIYKLICIHGALGRARSLLEHVPSAVGTKALQDDIVNSIKKSQDLVPEPAIAATFARWRTPLPDTVPEGLTEAFAADPMKCRQWEAFAAELAVNPNSLDCIVADLAAFLMAHVIRARAAAPKGPE